MKNVKINSYTYVVPHVSSGKNSECAANKRIKTSRSGIIT